MSSQRQLAAIMFTDIEGYTSLMHHNEKDAIAMRERHRLVFENCTQKFKGTIVQYFGDGTLSTFNSTVEAVNCAIELQQAFLEEPKIPVRIGIHVGDIIQSKDDIIGDAVNVASRIESCAVPGSVLISDKVHDQIRSHKHISTEFIDAYELKNIDHAIPIFAVSNNGLVIPKPEEIKGKLKQERSVKKEKKNYKFTAAILGFLFLIAAASLIYFQFFKQKKVNPIDYSIAVLPFDNLSSDDDAEIFRDGMTEDILTYLSKIKDLHVISRTSVMRYKDTKKAIPEIAKELGVSYILEGSIRKYGNKVRVTAQLIDAANDEHLWAENYDKTLVDIFEIQTQVSNEIVNALKLNLSFEEQQGLASIPTQNIDAYKLFLTGRKEADKRNKESIAKSILLYKEAIVLDQNYADAYAEIANSIYLETYYSGRNLKQAAQLAYEYLDKAEAINPNLARVYSVRGLINNIQGKSEEAQRAFEKAISLSPNDLTARHQFSTYYYYTQQFEKQLEQAAIAYKLDPLSFATANSYFTALTANRKFDEAELLMKKVERNDNDNNKFVINRSYFRLYMDQKKYKDAIPPLKEIIKTQNVFNRFLGYCYAKTGDTIMAYNTIDSIRKNAHPLEKNHQLAVVYAGLQVTDSVLYYLDTLRNKQTATFRRERTDFFEYLKDNEDFKSVLNDHGIQPKNN